MSSQVLPTKDEVNAQKEKRDGPPWESDKPVIVYIEKCGKIAKDDSYFYTELRVLSGAARGEIVKQNWSRKWQSGDWREDTVELLRTLCPDEAERGEPVWSHMLLEKCFTMTPWKNKKGYWNHKDFALAEIPEQDRAALQPSDKAPDGQEIPF